MNNSLNIQEVLGFGPRGMDLATVLLSTYQCFVDPDYFSEMTGMLTSWIEVDDDPVLVALLEKHSEDLWKRAYEQFLEAERRSRSDGRNKKMVSVAKISCSRRSMAFSEDVMEKLQAEDALRVEAWLKDLNLGKKREEILVRFYNDQGQPPHVAVLREPEDGGAELVISEVLFEETVMRLFKSSFRLTPRELEVLKSMASGLTPKEIAEQHDRGVEGVRSHIKSITSKLDVSGQTDVVRLLGEAVAVSSFQDSNALTKSDSSRLAVSPDGRKVDYEIDPPEEGMPLVFFHCLTSGRHWTARAKGIAAAHNFRLVRISRAAFGGSDVSRCTGLELLEVHSRDCAMVLDREKIHRCMVFAHGMGFPSAYYFCLRYPEKVVGLVGLDVPPPILSASDVKVLKGIFKTGALATRVAPSAAKLVASLAVKNQLKRGGVDLKNPIGMPNIDLTEHEDADGCDTIRQNNLDAMRNEGEGYWREGTCATVDWAAARQNANNLPVTRLVQSRNSPYIVPGGIDSFAARIGAHVRVIDSFLPMISGPFPAIAEELGRIQASGE